MGPGLSGCLELRERLQSPISAGLEGPDWDGGSACNGSRAGGPSEGASFFGLWLETWKEPPCSSKVMSEWGQFLPALKLKSCSEHTMSGHRQDSNPRPTNSQGQWHSVKVTVRQRGRELGGQEGTGRGRQVGPWSPNQGSNSLLWKHRVLTTGPPAKSQLSDFLTGW